MTTELQIDIKKTGFPVKLGELELWFDSSFENLRRFFNIEEIAHEKLKKAQEKAKHIHFPENEEDLDVSAVDAAFDVNKEFIAVQYDIIFGDNTFKKVYKKYPDILALEEALEVAGVAIASRIESLEEERSKKTEDKKAEFLRKKETKK